MRSWVDMIGTEVWEEMRTVKERDGIAYLSTSAILLSCAKTSIFWVRQRLVPLQIIRCRLTGSRQ